ncbi:MAG: hypothetical protein J7578_13360 [Chitinophagaceae bacterium]|nr:hypothetical protein [Chitinophagaceae bacterium]
MKLEYLEDLSDAGKYPWADPQHLIRLYCFDRSEAQFLIDLINLHIITNQNAIDFSIIPFLKLLNCQLRFELSGTDTGIQETDNRMFVCKLRIETYKIMTGYIQALINEDGSVSGYNWLYDPGPDAIDLLMSTGGSW